MKKNNRNEKKNNKNSQFEKLGEYYLVEEYIDKVIGHDNWTEEKFSCVATKKDNPYDRYELECFSERNWVMKIANDISILFKGLANTHQVLAISIETYLRDNYSDQIVEELMSPIADIGAVVTMSSALSVVVFPAMFVISAIPYNFCGLGMSETLIFTLASAGFSGFWKSGYKGIDQNVTSQRSETLDAILAIRKANPVQEFIQKSKTGLQVYVQNSFDNVISKDSLSSLFSQFETIVEGASLLGVKWAYMEVVSHTSDTYENGDLLVQRNGFIKFTAKTFSAMLKFATLYTLLEVSINHYNSVQSSFWEAPLNIMDSTRDAIHDTVKHVTNDESNGRVLATTFSLLPIAAEGALLTLQVALPLKFAFNSMTFNTAFKTGVLYTVALAGVDLLAHQKFIGKTDSLAVGGDYTKLVSIGTQAILPHTEVAKGVALFAVVSADLIGGCALGYKLGAGFFAQPLLKWGVTLAGCAGGTVLAAKEVIEVIGDKYITSRTHEQKAQLSDRHTYIEKAFGVEESTATYIEIGIQVVKFGSILLASKVANPVTATASYALKAICAFAIVEEGSSNDVVQYGLNKQAEVYNDGSVMDMAFKYVLPAIELTLAPFIAYKIGALGALGAFGVAFYALGSGAKYIYDHNSDYFGFDGAGGGENFVEL
jgi:hypothetical protein